MSAPLLPSVHLPANTPFQVVQVVLQALWATLDLRELLLRTGLEPLDFSGTLIALALEPLELL